MREHDAPVGTKSETIAVSSLRREDLGPGSSLGPYVLQHVIARGAFGTVYRATTRGGAAVALKLLHGGLIDAPGVVERFFGEVELIRSLSHPGIVEILSTGETSDGQPWLVMEWLEGRTLQAIIAEGPLPLERAISLLGKLCDVLSVVHAAGIVHRDLKGANVMIVGEGEHERVKLLDFGVAKLVSEKSSLTLHGTRIGTPSHMAPEQILGGRITAQTDIYALGVILFAMLTGRLPFEASSPVEVEEMHLDKRPPCVSEFVDVPPVVSDVVRRCLAKKTFQRYGSVEELMAEFSATASMPAAAPSSLRAGRAMAAGVFVSVEDQGPDAQAAMVEARRIFEDEGVEIALEDEQGLWLLGITGLSSMGIVTPKDRERAVLVAIAAVRGGTGLAGVRAVVHVAPVTTLAVEGAVQMAGGELLSPEVWAKGAAPLRVEATPEALAGIQVDLAPEAARPEGRVVVLGLVPVSKRRAR